MLSLAQLRDDFCATALRSFLLWNGIVGARQTGRGAVPTRASAVADTLDLALVTAVAGPLCRAGRGGRGDWRGRRSGGFGHDVQWMVEGKKGS